MAWNPSPQVADARDFAKKHGKKMVIILHVDGNSLRLGYASYGLNRKLCAEAKTVADKAFDAVMAHYENL